MKLTHNQIFYSKVGHGPHLCFLHGFCENGSIWEEVIEELKESYTCISIDLPGFGLSSSLVFNSIPEVANQVRELLNGLGIENPILFGHSMGGYIVAEYSASYSAEIKGAAFIHSTSRADSELKKLNRDKIVDFVRNYGGSKFFPSFVQGLVFKQNFSRLEEKLLSLVQSTPDSSIISALLAMKNRKDNLEALRKFDKPVLFLMGDKDTHFSSEEMYHQASLCSLVQLDVIKNVGHLSMFENKKKCLKSIKHFLQFVELTT